MPQLFQQNEATAQYRRFYISIADPDNPLLGKEGLTVTGADFRITKAGGAFGDFAGTVTGVSDGLYLCEAAAADLDTLGALVGKIEMTGAVTRTYDCGQVVPWDPYDASLLGLSGVATSAALASVATAVTRLLGLAHENAKLDGGGGVPEVVHVDGKQTFARLRQFVDSTDLDAATAGAADDADGEIHRWEITTTYDGNNYATHQIAQVL